MKNPSKLSFVAAAVVLLVSCSDETTIFKDPSSDISIEDSQVVLDNSIVYDNAGVIDIFEENGLSGKTYKRPEDEPAGDYPLTLIAQVDPPSSGGDSVTATHVHLVDNYAYVSYNTAGAVYAGGIDVVDVSNPNTPRVVSRLYYSNADINSLKYDNGYVYAVGGVDSETSVRATSNSFIAKIPVPNGRIETNGIIYSFHQGFVSTDVLVYNNKVMVTSGKDGSLTVYNKATLDIEEEIPFPDLRSIAINNGKIALLDGSSGVNVLDESYSNLKQINIDSDLGIAKRTIDFFENKIIVSEGASGAGVYDYTTGVLLERLAIMLSPEGVDSADIVTNAVAINDGVILMANGGAGLCLSEDTGDSTNVVGVVELNGSINYVESRGDYIFAASGKEGLQIIKLNKPDVGLEAKCSSVPAYPNWGSSWLNVNSGETLAYSGSKRFNSINVSEGELLLCGAWTVKNNVNLNANSLFEMNGSLSVGSNRRKKTIMINSGAVLRVEGSLTIYGDLVLNDGATIEFIGSDSVVEITGSVRRSGSVTVTGDFTDVRNSF